jgi:glyoxylase-like metal-dependent hydrolase (beta-lactamase superfamily II)
MKLTDKIHMLQIDFKIILGSDQMVPRFVNVLIILGEKITLIDTGVKGSEGKIFAYIRGFGREPSEIQSVILSHSHPDHIGSVARIKELTGCKVLAHPFEKEWIENITLQNKERPIPGFYSLVDRSVKVDGDLSDGQIIPADEDIPLEIIHSPGHSKGSVNIFLKDKFLFTADSIPLKNDFPNYDSYPDLIQSLNHIKEKRRYTMLLTSWTPPLDDMFEAYGLLSEGEEYLKLIDVLVKKNYRNAETEPLSCCRETIEQLGLPSFMANQVADRAFRSHLELK